MILDYDKIKLFLKIFIEDENPFLNTVEIFSKLNYNINNDIETKEVWHYLKLLSEQKLIECIEDKENLGFSFLGNGRIVCSVKKIRITNSGYQTYEIITTNKIWNKIKTPLKTFGVESLKQIPSLAIKIITESI
ncbi:hypothetical protein DMB65_21245 [Flavobacterium cheongpyeongense]|uniref:DUF2513 domain-containing protein n=1 Tax=Flavobacterium cheongpyeongense TaxID=2212651 RepID=A0A2V4BJI1_9FLAO|nr:hypothetical protein [Flavobacterium cheongpyeongense]PXY38742.1 hypothetical protein DMB65_21245 [Flavobacterium cheongpyeongense]